ncbi:MAG: phosphatase PAP2 family protein [Actinomycetota bacterium]
MNLTLGRTTDLPAARKLRDGRRVFWWLEVLALVGFYFVYSAIRNANEGGTREAYRNAERVIDWQQAIGIFHEETLQDWAQHWKFLIIAANYFYGSLHFVVTIAAGIYLFRKFTDDYPRFRNTLAVTTALALVGFVLFPLMPPRLLLDFHDYGFTDTLAQYPTFWSFNSGAVSKISNQYAAMPSVHVAWAIWTALVFAPRVKHRWARILAIAYPIATVVVIVITGNHYLLDAVGGVLVLAAGWFVAHRLTRAGRGEPAYAASTASTSA